MDYVVNLTGLVNSLWILYYTADRKYFCICDKITIGDQTPQCAYGAISHLISILLAVCSLEGYSFYPLSLWLFVLLYSGIYLYKSIKEICKGCAIAFGSAVIATIISMSKLDYYPWIAISIYLAVFMLSICLTSLSINNKTN